MPQIGKMKFPYTPAGIRRYQQIKNAMRPTGNKKGQGSRRFQQAQATNLPANRPVIDPSQGKGSDSMFNPPRGVYPAPQGGRGPLPRPPSTKPQGGRGPLPIDPGFTKPRPPARPGMVKPVPMPKRPRPGKMNQAFAIIRNSRLPNRPGKRPPLRGPNDFKPGGPFARPKGPNQRRPM